MNWLDIIIIVTIVISFVGGLATGLIKGVLTLIGLIVGIVIAGRTYAGLAERLTLIHNEGAASVAAFAIIFLLVIVITALLVKLLRAAVVSAMLGWLDRILGGLVGVLLGVVSWGLVLALWAKFFGGSALQNSVIAPFLVEKFPLVLTLLPSEFDSVREFFS